MNAETLSVISIVLSVAALCALLVQWKRVAVLRRRAKRSLYVGPDPHLRLQKQVYDRAARLEAARRGWEPPLPIEFRSEWGEDTLLFDLFEGQESGVYIEAGALDGRENSVTWVFEALGWTGLLVEAIPERAEQCRSHRPGSRVVHAALDAERTDGTVEFLVPSDPEQQPSAHRADRHSSEVDAGLERAGARMSRVSVPLTTMNAALEQAGFDRVDFAIIDVEGMEPEVLRGFDLARFAPRVLIIEDLGLGVRDELTPLLEPAGYRQAMWLGANRVYVRRDDQRLSERADRLAETVYSPLVRPRGHKSHADYDLP
ncbi:MAG: FkbM family methyltransferase [Phycisphaerales bacterium JB040]